MLHCPYCGCQVKEDEIFCTQCGRKLPDDLVDRIPSKNNNNYRLWLLPSILFIIIFCSIIWYDFHLENNTEKAQSLYKQGEALTLEGDYQEALTVFEEALQYKSQFPAATTNKNFVKRAIEIEADLQEVESLIQNKEFQSALTHIDEAENKVKIYNGEAVRQLINKIVTKRKQTQLSQLTSKLEQSPTIDEIKDLLWEAEAIQTEEANSIANDLKNQIIAFISSTASEQLKLNQFTDARAIVNDGLKYAPDSEKLQSLKTTIEKEKAAFETKQQERIEQALNAAEQERQQNQNNAVELVEIELEEDDNQELVVSGEIKSVATVPINSISIEYVIYDKDENEILTNEVYVYPDTLYPDEEGKFDYTHYDLELDLEELEVNTETIKWFLD
ncbi:zinc-ribbon domain-containing protein [Aquibacillus sediminis]|uniref:zinc-ribbon domain-containing protein n=1 Tax=Aquibacillus sediminis TaxID=2574734 RepID=UPI0011088C75|nr:zinc-ribbon domain-containing protein [Aquibacillus sediminis]